MSEDLDGMFVQLKRGLKTFRRTVGEEVLVFMPERPVAIQEHQLVGLIKDIEIGTLQPVEWRDEPRGWHPIPLEELDLEGQVQALNGYQQVDEFLRRQRG